MRWVVRPNSIAAMARRRAVPVQPLQPIRRSRDRQRRARASTAWAMYWRSALPPHPAARIPLCQGVPRTWGVPGQQIDSRTARLCLDVNHGSGPDIDFYVCHAAASPDVAHQQFYYIHATRQLQAANTSLCLALNRTKLLPYINPPWCGPPPPDRNTGFSRYLMLVVPCLRPRPTTQRMAVHAGRWAAVR